jgi:hypothetical protein
MAVPRRRRRNTDIGASNRRWLSVEERRPPQLPGQRPPIRLRAVVELGPVFLEHVDGQLVIEEGMGAVNSRLLSAGSTEK